MNQPKEEPSNSNLGSPPKFSNATITSLHNSVNISSVPSTILNHTNPIPTSVHNNNISTVQSTLFNHTNPILHQNGNQNYNSSLLPLPPNLQLLNNNHFLDPKNQASPAAHTSSYFPPNAIPIPDPKPKEEPKPEKEEYRGKSRYKVNPHGKMWDCKECGVTLKAKASLDLHIRSKHMHIKDFKCPFCEYKSTQKGAIGGHMAAAHKKTEKFECNECKKMLDGKREATHHFVLKIL